MAKSSKSKYEVTQDLIKVFRKNGLHGTTLSKLTEGCGLERASLYHHFPKGKNQMALAVLDQVVDELNEKVLSILREENLKPKQKLSEMLLAIHDFYSGGESLCFITIFSIAEENKDLSNKILLGTNIWLSLLEDVFSSLNYKEVKNEAVATLSTVQGGLVLSHVTKKPELFKICLQKLAISWQLNLNI